MRAPFARLRVAILTACSVVCVGRAAQATNSNPNYLPFGGSESFLGNAGVARANDTGAVYYHPACLAEIGDGRVSVSGALYLSFSTHFDAITRADDANIPFDFSGFNTIPSTYVATRRFSDWVVALSVLVPNSGSSTITPRSARPIPRSTSSTRSARASFGSACRRRAGSTTAGAWD